MCNCVEEVVQPTINRPLVVERRSDGLTLTIEEIDTTEKPNFIDHCYDCNKGIMDLAISKRIYDLWEMDYCDCDDSDSDYD